MTFPLVLGRGKRLFGDNAQASAFILERSISTPGGVLITRYARSGKVRTGAFDEGE
ncbi:hypothetical protein J2X06_000386 [Lysobacter niastensis]|uniref:Uncharacterized protein n=2 Tax=Lysobacter niastensis TaxID=380629 RepID=A0ABU1W6V9_9GAMM|nr:hypothetical protein [Lysobacter niastensis]